MNPRFSVARLMSRWNNVSCYRDALEAGQVQIDGKDPLAQGKMRVAHDGSGLDAEIPDPAIDEHR